MCRSSCIDKDLAERINKHLDLLVNNNTPERTYAAVANTMQTYSRSPSQHPQPPAPNSKQKQDLNRNVVSSVNEDNSVIITNITSRSFLKDSGCIIKHFNKHFNGIKVKTYFTTKRGAVILEFADPNDAVEVSRHWKPDFFTDEKSTKNTSCNILRTFNKSVIIKGVPKYMESEDLANHLAKK